MPRRYEWEAAARRRQRCDFCKNDAILPRCPKCGIDYIEAHADQARQRRHAEIWRRSQDIVQFWAIILGLSLIFAGGPGAGSRRIACGFFLVSAAIAAFQFIVDRRNRRRKT